MFRVHDYAEAEDGRISWHQAGPGQPAFNRFAPGERASAFGRFHTHGELLNHVSGVSGAKTERAESRGSPMMLAIADHAVIGDRRTAAMVAADGAIVWYCLPHYAGLPICGAILDAERGGFWRMGPDPASPGHQRYEANSATLVTSWRLRGGSLELTDAMAWPWDDRRGNEGGPTGRVILRRLRCTHGTVPVRLDYQPRAGFTPLSSLSEGERGLTTWFDGQPLTLWTSLPMPLGGNHEATLRTELSAGQEIWSVLSWGEEEPAPWTVQRAATELAAVTTYWRNWLATLSDAPTRAPDLLRHALTLKLLTYAPTGSPVAAPTSSLPERLGGNRNWDYRYAWVRDAALCISVLCQLGDLATGRRYMDCLATYDSSTESPLQVVYGVDGALNLPEHERWDLAGYAHSLPVRVGNRACTQRQLDSLGFFVNSALTYLTCGGEWTEDHWQMVHRAADYTADHWRLPDSGLWEHEEERQYVSSKVMSWVALERACRIAERLGKPERVAHWREVQVEIHADVLRRGWNERRQAFTECYEDETLDASALLMPLMGFLPIDDPRVIATIERIQAELMVDGFVYRRRSAIDGKADGREGAFLPCTCWMAMVLIMAQRTDEAEALLAQVATAAGERGILSEQIDPADRSFLGNLPLVFTHAEYLRARLLLSQHGEAGSCASPARRKS